MYKVFLTNVFVSKGFEDKPAVNFSEKGDVAWFRVGHKVYDPNAEDNTRWVNRAVKAFKSLAERIKKMNLDAGSCINIEGVEDDIPYEDSEGNKKVQSSVIVITNIEYAGSAGGKSTDKESKHKKDSEEKSTKKKSGDSENYEGYSAYSGNPFFEA